MNLKNAVMFGSYSHSFCAQPRAMHDNVHPSAAIWTANLLPIG